MFYKNLYYNLLLAVISPTLAMAANATTYEKCETIEDPTERVACYDSLTNKSKKKSKPNASQQDRNNKQIRSAKSEVVPVGGHNGISFDMNQKQVEKLGFVCQESKPNDWYQVSCSHMSMTGRAFDHNTAGYEVLINRQDGKVCQIDATFTDVNQLFEYMSMSTKVQNFYPTNVSSKLSKSMCSSMWIDMNKARLVLDYYKGVPPFLPNKISVHLLVGK